MFFPTTTGRKESEQSRLLSAVVEITLGNRQNARFSKSICTLSFPNDLYLKFSTFQTGRDNSKRYVIKIVSNRYILIIYIIYDCCCLCLIHYLRLQKYDNFTIWPNLFCLAYHWERRRPACKRYEEKGASNRMLPFCLCPPDGIIRRPRCPPQAFLQSRRGCRQFGRPLAPPV